MLVAGQIHNNGVHGGVINIIGRSYTSAKEQVYIIHKFIPKWVIFHKHNISIMFGENFRQGIIPREGQKYILNQIDSLVKSGHKQIIISAPTGIGKSYVAKAIADTLNNAFIITSTKLLQEQYKTDFIELKSIKGKSNFECRQLVEKDKTQNMSKALLRGLTCDKGRCVIKDGSKVRATCEYREPRGDGKQCAYYKQKDDGLAYNQTILNYAMYFHLKAYQSDLPGMDRSVIVFDEAHTIENEVVRFIGYDVWGSYLMETNLDQKNFELESIDGMLNLLDSLKAGYKYMIQQNSEPNTPLEIMAQKRMEQRLDGIVSVSKEIQANSQNFIMQEPEFDSQGSLRRVSVTPLDISRYTSKLFDSDIQMYMSATIDKKNFSKIMGFKDCGFINVPKSPFPLENRRIVFNNVARLSSRAPESDDVAVAKVIDSIMSMYPDSRGLILTSSKYRCKNLERRLSPAQARRIQLAHSVNEDNSTIDEVLKHHAEIPNGVLLSSSLWQGIDLKGDLSRFQIVEKCPYPYLGDRRVKAKNQADRSWYTYQTIIKLLQGFGRSIRDNNDHATTYVMDSSVQSLLNQNREMVPAAYHDALFT